MPSLLWLALLLGYLTGVAAAVLLLPSRLIEPLYGPLALTTVVVIAAFVALLRLRRVSQAGDSGSAAAPHHPPGARRLRALADEAEGANAGALQLRGPVDEANEVDAGELPPDDREPAEGERWPLMVRLEAPGVIGPSELRHTLYQGLVDLRLRPIASLAQPQAALYYALPRLRSVDGQPLEPASYRTTAARAGLLGTIDRLLLLRCVDMLRAARAEHAVTVLCGIAAASLNDPGFIAELEQQLSDDPSLAASLLLTLDQMLCDRPSVVAASGLRARGVRFCLRRLGPPQLDPAALRTAGFAFVLLAAERFALAPEGAPDPALLELQKVLGQNDPQLLVGRAAASTVTFPGPWALSAGHGADLAPPSAA